MYLFQKPSAVRIHEFIESQSRLEFTYPSIGATRNGNHPSGYVLDHHSIHLGAGQTTFEAARQALCEWQHYHFDWIELQRPEEDPQPHQTVGGTGMEALGTQCVSSCLCNPRRTADSQVCICLWHVARTCGNWRRTFSSGMASKG